MSLALASRAMPRDLDSTSPSAPPSLPSFGPPFLWAGPRLIGICGLAGVGKSTAARILVDAHGFERLRFAGPIKAMLRALGLSEEQVDGSLKEMPTDLLCGKTPREAMQLLGTEFGRFGIGKTIWTDAWLRQYRAATSRALPVVVDDVRFSNEVEIIRSLGGLVVRIVRPGAAASVGADHASETQRVDADIQLLNDGSIASLESAICALAERM